MQVELPDSDFYPPSYLYCFGMAANNTVPDFFPSQYNFGSELGNKNDSIFILRLCIVHKLFTDKYIRLNPTSLSKIHKLFTDKYIKSSPT